MRVFTADVSALYAERQRLAKPGDAIILPDVISKEPLGPAVRSDEVALGARLGVDNAWALRAVKATGNYAEIFERNVGAKSKLGIPRGLNQLWSIGGILYAPPVR